MSYISRVSKPNIALVKLIEAVGILLRVQKSFAKSVYKAPTPSNYDGTLALLTKDFAGCILILGTLRSDDIPNDVASDLYSKTLEQGFEYEKAVAVGGLEARDLYNSIMAIIDRLNADLYRIPIKKTNVMVLADGSRPSFVAFDTATHLHHHGKIIVGALLVAGSRKINGAVIQAHLPVDLERRCRDQYKIDPLAYKIDVLRPHLSSEIVQHVEQSMSTYDCSTLVLGIDANYTGTENLSITAQWAAWKTGYITVLVKSCSRIRPFTAVSMPRKVMVCIKDQSAIDDLYKTCLKFLKPGDEVLMVSVVNNGDPIGDNRSMRFDLGGRCRWVAGAVEDSLEPNCVGWNKEIIEALQNRMDELLRISQMPGWCGIRVCVLLLMVYSVWCLSVCLSVCAPDTH